MGISEKVVNVYYHLTGQNIIEQAEALKGDVIRKNRRIFWRHIFKVRKWSI